MNNELQDMTKHPRWQIGYTGNIENKKLEIVDIHTPWTSSMKRELCAGFDLSYQRVDELNREHYGDDRFAGWQKNVMSKQAELYVRIMQMPLRDPFGDSCEVYQSKFAEALRSVIEDGADLETGITALSAEVDEWYEREDEIGRLQAV